MIGGSVERPTGGAYLTGVASRLGEGGGGGGEGVGQLLVHPGQIFGPSRKFGSGRKHFRCRGIGERVGEIAELLGGGLTFGNRVLRQALLQPGQCCPAGQFGRVALLCKFLAALAECRDRLLERLRLGQLFDQSLQSLPNFLRSLGGHLF